MLSTLKHLASIAAATSYDAKKSATVPGGSFHSLRHLGQRIAQLSDENAAGEIDKDEDSGRVRLRDRLKKKFGREP